MNDYIFTFGVVGKGKTEQEAWEDIKDFVLEKIAKNNYDAVEKLLDNKEQK